MDGLSSVIGVQICTIFLAAITHASLQIGPSALLLLYHASLGKHVKKRTKYLVSNFILGSALLICLIVSTLAFAIISLMGQKLTTDYLIGISVILVVLAILAWIFYFKTGRSTELWIPKTVARYINRRANITESNVEAFSLGMLTTFAEMPFSIVLMIVAGNAVLILPFGLQFIAILIYTFISVLPLWIMRYTIKHGRTVVDIQKWRVKNKDFFRFLTGFLFLTLATFIIAFFVLGVE